MAPKRIKGEKTQSEKVVISTPVSYDSQYPVWRFDKLDRDGEFAFDLNKINCRLVLEKLIEYGCLTWKEITSQTHDARNKSKHHYLKNAALSREAELRVRAKHLEEDVDNIFSFALNNKLRIIGIKRGAEFYVIWHDPEHRFCPSTK